MDCAICSDPVIVDESAQKCSNCETYFHGDCIHGWHLTSKNCPACGKLLVLKAVAAATSSFAMASFKDAVPNSTPMNFSINVQNPAGKVKPLTVNPHMKVSELREMVNQAFGGNLKVRMIFAGATLEDEDKLLKKINILETYRIENGNTINMTGHMVGGSVSGRNRLMEEYKLFLTSNPPGISVMPDDENIFLWKGIIFGPSRSAWNNGAFPLKIEFPPSYPSSPPTIYFEGEMFHPNIYSDGRVCMTTLDAKRDYEPSLTVISLLNAIQSLLANPNVNSPANCIAADMLTNDIRAYHKKVKEIVEKSG